MTGWPLPARAPGSNVHVRRAPRRPDRAGRLARGHVAAARAGARVAQWLIRAVQGDAIESTRERCCQFACFSAMRFLFLSACSSAAAGLLLGDGGNRTAAHLFPRGQGATDEDGAIEESFRIAYGHFENRRRAPRDPPERRRSLRAASTKRLRWEGRGRRGRSDSGLRFARKDALPRVLQCGLRLAAGIFTAVAPGV